MKRSGTYLMWCILSYMGSSQGITDIERQSLYHQAERQGIVHELQQAERWAQRSCGSSFGRRRQAISPLSSYDLLKAFEQMFKECQ